MTRVKPNPDLRGVTLLETLTCLGIIAAVAAITATVTTGMRKSAKVAASVSNLHQLQIALALYRREEPSPGSQISELESVGLPGEMEVLMGRLGLPTEVWKSPCGQNPSWNDQPVTLQYEYFLGTMLDPFPSAWNTYGEQAVAFIDMNCAEHGAPLKSEYVPHLGLGVTLAGNLIRANRPGDYQLQSWWQNAPH